MSSRRPGTGFFPAKRPATPLVIGLGLRGGIGVLLKVEDPYGCGRSVYMQGSMMLPTEELYKRQSER